MAQKVLDRAYYMYVLLHLRHHDSERMTRSEMNRLQIRLQIIHFCFDSLVRILSRKNI